MKDNVPTIGMISMKSYAEMSDEDISYMGLTKENRVEVVCAGCGVKGYAIKNLVDSSIREFGENYQVSCNQCVSRGNGTFLMSAASLEEMIFSPGHEDFVRSMSDFIGIIVQYPVRFHADVAEDDVRLQLAAPLALDNIQKAFTETSSGFQNEIGRPFLNVIQIFIADGMYLSALQTINSLVVMSRKRAGK